MDKKGKDKENQINYQKQKYLKKKNSNKSNEIRKNTPNKILSNDEFCQFHIIDSDNSKTNKINNKNIPNKNNKDIIRSEKRKSSTNTNTLSDMAKIHNLLNRLRENEKNRRNLFKNKSQSKNGSKSQKKNKGKNNSSQKNKNKNKNIVYKNQLNDESTDKSLEITKSKSKNKNNNLEFCKVKTAPKINAILRKLQNFGKDKKKKEEYWNAREFKKK
jgi:hypothetical protein